MSPNPKNVSNDANVTLTLSGNSLAMMANDAVKNAAFPNASMIRIKKANVINRVCPYLRGKYITNYENYFDEKNVENFQFYLNPVKQSKNNGWRAGSKNTTIE